MKSHSGRTLRKRSCPPIHGSHMRKGRAEATYVGFRTALAFVEHYRSACPIHQERDRNEAEGALLQFHGARVQLVVLALLRDELVVRAALDDAAMVEHHDHV